ncbi:hypothetical protein ACQPW1_10485 [Nocardia sp. CA-128927]|uniref:hypothetical protein n=1 Tax=Nocardia sp. CA-128927 TaxID=3239975 RepID=UPI003D987376
MTVEKISYTPEEASAATGLQRRKIYDAMTNFELAFHPVGRNKIIMREELVRWLRTHQPGQS